MQFNRLSVINTSELPVLMRRIADTTRCVQYVAVVSDSQIRNLAQFVGYRAQLACFELLSKTDPDVDWGRFVEAVCQSEEIKTHIEAAALRAIEAFDYSKLDFSIPAGALSYFEGPGVEEPVIAANLFPDDFRRALIQYFVLTAEHEHYRRIIKTDPEYRWSEYLDDLIADQELWGRVSRAIQYGLRQIDFHAVWEQEFQMASEG